jgi:uncharacterized protein YrrD
MDPAGRSTHGRLDGGADPVPHDAALFGRDVTHTNGLRLGRIEAVVHQLDGGRLAVVRRGLVFRRWYFVSLAGASVLDDRVIVSAPVGRGRPHRRVAPAAS